MRLAGENSDVRLSERCLADGTPFSGISGWYWWVRGVRRSPADPNLCNR
jgi:hypothetical protein